MCLLMIHSFLWKMNVFLLIILFLMLVLILVYFMYPMTDKKIHEALEREIFKKHLNDFIIFFWLPWTNRTFYFQKNDGPKLKNSPIKVFSFSLLQIFLPLNKRLCLLGKFKKYFDTKNHQKKLVWKSSSWSLNKNFFLLVLPLFNHFLKFIARD